MATNLDYHYNIQLKYINQDKQETMDPKSIRLIVIDYDYETKNMPVIYMQLNLEVPIYNDMVLNSKSGKIFLNIKYYDAGSSNPIMKDYIKEQFSYFLSNKELEYDENIIKEAGTEKIAYRRVTLGLIKSELVDNNKRIMNNIFKNTNISSIVHYYTNHMKMIIEPFDNNPFYNLFIVPPIEGITKLIKFLNESCAFYNTSYRYFMDFSTTYLLSTRGKAIDIKDGTYTTVKIDILPNTPTRKVKEGMERDTTNELYIIEIDAKDFSILKNEITEKKFNKLYGVDSLGNKANVSLNINNEKGSSTKTKMVRIYNNNMSYLNSLANEIENSSSIITVVKGDINASIIVPYKEYRISNINQYKNLDGKYILVAKKEVFVQSDNDYRCSVSMSFKKVS